METNTIIFAILAIGALFAVIYSQVVLARENAPTDFRIFIGIVGFGLVGGLFYLLPDMNKEEKATRISKKNLIAYYAHREELKKNMGFFESLPWAPRAVYTSAKVNFREGSTTKSKVIKLLNVNERVLLTQKRERNWFEVIYDGRKGWVFGKYLQVKSQVDGAAFKNLLLMYFFPESRIWQNILGVLIGLVIGAITYLISLNADADADSFTLGISFAYFLVKNAYFLEISFTAFEMALLLVTVFIWSAVTGGIQKIIFLER